MSERIGAYGGIRPRTGLGGDGRGVRPRAARAGAGAVA